MKIRYTLLADGPSDSALLPILTWLIKRDLRVSEIDVQFAHPTVLPSASKGLAARATAALSLYPANILFVHRDAEREPGHVRRQEIMEALARPLQMNLFIPVVPVRMTEAWLLFNEAAIRRAAGNPNGRMPLNLPRVQDIELIPMPKGSLQTALKTACELRGRALAKFNAREAAGRVADLIDDFSPLCSLNAFKDLQADIRIVIAELAEGTNRGASAGKAKTESI